MKSSLSVYNINRITVIKAVQLQYYYKKKLRLKNGNNLLILPTIISFLVDVRKVNSSPRQYAMKANDGQRLTLVSFSASN